MMLLEQTKFELAELERIDRITTVHHVTDDGVAWGTHGRSIYTRRQGGAWERVNRFPFLWSRDVFGWNRLVTRASRADKCNLFCASGDRTIGIRGGTVFSVTSDAMIPLFDIRGDCVLNRGICEDQSGNIYVGEYFGNQDRDAVHIWRLCADLSRHEVAYEFAAGSVRHIHGLIRDPFDPSAIWVTVGDFQGECYLYRTDDQFRSLERFGDGTQLWRAVSLFFTEEHVSWLTDSHLDQNHACRMSRATGELEVGQGIPSSSWYGTTTIEGLYVAFTVIEDGPGILTDTCLVLASDDAFQWQQCAEFRKDRWRPYSVFRYGSIMCPLGRMSSEEFYLSLDAVEGFDGCSLRVRLVPQA